ncbi:MAG: hypothetical protein EOP06_05205 [Proteobacteria bacterium]|nr:MAG: hypothetical protein EOP06_05205 [Pseudomonadota bacterium]
MKQLLATSLILLASTSSFANRESGGRDDGRGGAVKNVPVPALACVLREPSRNLFGLNISETNLDGEITLSVIGSGPDDRPIVTESIVGSWASSSGREAAISGSNFLFRLFKYDSQMPPDGYYATIQEKKGPMVLLFCKPSTGER